MGWLSGFDNSSSSTSEHNIDDITTTNASYGGGSPVNLNLSDLTLKGGKYARNNLTISPTINVTDGGAIQAALGVVERSQETQSQQALQFAEIARQAGQPAGALIENIGKYVMISAVVGVVSLVIWKQSK